MSNNGQMIPTNPLPAKPFWKRKKFWAGVIVVATGLVAAIFDGWTEGGAKILEGLQIIFSNAGLLIGAWL